MSDHIEGNFNVYREIIAQATVGRIAAAIPLNGVNGAPITYMVAADPTKDPTFNPAQWAHDPTDYTGMYDGADYFGTDGIGVVYAMAMIHYAHHSAHENGLDELDFNLDDEDE
jgi:hypothetical protein